MLRITTRNCYVIMISQSYLIHDIEQLRSELARLDSQFTGSVLVQIFSSQPRSLVTQYSREIQQYFNDVTIIGASGKYAIKSGTIQSESSCFVFTYFKQSTCTSSVVSYSANAASDSQLLAKNLNLSSSTKAIICFADRLSVSERSLFSAFSEGEYRIPVAGGASADTDTGRWILHNQTIYENAYVAVVLHGAELSAWTGSYYEWNPIGKKFRITHADKHRIYSLDDQPIQHIYNRYLADGLDVPYAQITDFPLMIGDPREQNVYLPLACHQDNSITFDGEFNVGDEVRFCYDHPSLTIEQVRLGLQQVALHHPQQFFIYNCISRLDFIEGNQELEPFQQVANSDGFFCFGEFCYENDHQQILHHSLTYLALREGPADNVVRSIPHHEHTSSISPLFSLIRNALLDVDIMHQDMAQKIQHQAKALTTSYRIERRTGLPNRTVLREHLAKMKKSEYLLTLKVTNFHQINEKYGYPVGDMLLSDLSQYFKDKLHGVFDKKCQLYGVGIGEWSIIFESQNKMSHIQQRFSEFAENIEHVNFEPMGLPDVDYLSVSVSAGIISKADFPNSSVDDLLLRSIEARRYAVSNNQHCCNARTLKEQEQKRQEQLRVLSCVSRAVLNQNVIAYAQPIVAAHSHEVQSLECLVRIEEEGVIIPPGKFLSIIEDTHLYTRLSRQMISRTFDFMSNTTDSFSINLSPQDLMSDRTLQHLEAAISKISHPQRIGLEVLESEKIKDYGRMIEVCDHFKDLGVSIIVDDFGSGYSNIDEIIKLEPQVIKLDGSLIRNIDTDKKQRKIAQQLVSLCGIFKAKTVAEFVHNQEVCNIAEDIGVDYLQGYYLGKPKRLF
ncbi:sensor domain-containing phosphodiesterase [Vibrionales bacterium C3R12]|nr:sensor domain-containing phosphodiesterase [Vibrionales bacterium C3R12]